MVGECPAGELSRTLIRLHSDKKTGPISNPYLIKYKIMYLFFHLMYCFKTFTRIYSTDSTLPNTSMVDAGHYLGHYQNVSQGSDLKYIKSVYTCNLGNLFVNIKLNEIFYVILYAIRHSVMAWLSFRYNVVTDEMFPTKIVIHNTAQ